MFTYFQRLILILMGGFSIYAFQRDFFRFGIDLSISFPTNFLPVIVFFLIITILSFVNRNRTKLTFLVDLYSVIYLTAYICYIHISLKI